MTEPSFDQSSSPPAPPTQDERTMAILAHVLQLVGSFIAPLVILLAKRNSRFVSFHALQALLLQIVYVVFGMLVLVTLVSTFFVTAVHQGGGNNRPPLALLVLFPLIWLGLTGTGIFTLVVAILYGIKAGRGEWAAYPVIGKVARKILKIDPPQPTAT